MFTGIIETLGSIKSIQREGANVHLEIHSTISPELKVDQSVSHNGVCLTVVALGSDTHTVTCIQETLDKSNLGELKIGAIVNLERAMLANARLDGHLVQGHVDTTAICTEVAHADGSWYYRFSYKKNPLHLLVNKGSVCINGVSLTVVDPDEDSFSVAIIPYTYEHTTFKNLQKDHTVNLEFDIIGKYIGQYMQVYQKKRPS